MITYKFNAKNYCRVLNFHLYIIIVFSGYSSFSQTKLANDVTTPLHLMQPDYPISYGEPNIESIIEVLSRVHKFLDNATPSQIIDSSTKREITDFKKLDSNSMFGEGLFRLTSYEWGVTYAGMLLAGEVTGDGKFTDYTNKRLKLIADIAPFFEKQLSEKEQNSSPIHSVLKPQALDDAGAICAAMIKARQAGLNANLQPLIDNFIDYISVKQYRLPDGTLARNRPQPNTLWVDDLFMSVPALAQMGNITGEIKYFDDAVKQVLQFSKRMFNPEKGLYMHGWVQSMETHPQFYWGRANGWAVMAMVELLDVLPKDHAGYPEVLNQLQSHIDGLASYQDGTGFWHQLIDRNDTYLETSATAIFTYAIAKAINKGLIDDYAYSPVAILAWNAIATKVNAEGQIEGTCVGTGMGFDPAFYYYRPIHVFAAHGYGLVMLAGSEIIRLIKTHDFEINESSLLLRQTSGNK